MRFSFSLLFLLLICHNGLCVDRTKFKTCEQSGFCRRCRAKVQENLYQLVDGSLIQKPDNTFSFDLINLKLNELKVMGQLIFYENNIIRVVLNIPELNRYHLKDSLLPHLPDIKNDIKVVNKENIYDISYGLYTIRLNKNPFQLIILNEKKQPTLVLNRRNLMKFEQGSENKDIEEDPAMNEIQQPQNDPSQENEKEQEKSTQNNSNEERFGDNVDSRPKGNTAIGFDLLFANSSHLYGIPEHADSFALKSTEGDDPFRLYNFDVFEYEIGNKMALYGSIPYMISHTAEQTVGFFWNNPSETWIDVNYEESNGNLGAQTHWMSESGVFDAFFLLGPKPQNVFKQYALLTGTTPLPPISSLGYHQSRWNYDNVEDVAKINSEADYHNVPLDFVWLDIEHTDNKKYFTWDPLKFANASAMIADLVRKKRKLVTIVDPHIKREDGYFIYDDAQALKWVWIKNKDKTTDFEGWCWPGTSKYPDFAKPEVRAWWASKFAFDRYRDTTRDVYIWNDMNEPSVFSGPEVTMPKDCVHLDGTVEHRDIHNMYGLYVHSATFQGLFERSDGKIRPFVLSRAFFAGSQRTAAVWTGDNSAEWSHLKITVPMMLSLSVTGITFSGADIGGFFRNPDSELLRRWYQAAAYQPFFRAHSHIDTPRREPWIHLNDLSAIRQSIYERYTYLPFWYTLFYESEHSGMPIMRPIWVNFPNNTDSFSIDSEYMIGDSLLVHPIGDAGAVQVNAYFPGPHEIWYDTYSDHVVQADHSKILPIPIQNNIMVYQRGGSIIPRKLRQRRSATIMWQKDNPFTLYIALDSQGEAFGTLYIDDGISYEYHKGKYFYAHLYYAKNTLSARIIHMNLDDKADTEVERIYIRGLPKRPKNILLTTSPNTKAIPLYFKYRDTDRSIEIKKPIPDLRTDWKINISY